MSSVILIFSVYYLRILGMVSLRLKEILFNHCNAVKRWTIILKNKFIQTTMYTCNKLTSFAVCILFIVINACNPELIPLKGKYAETPVEISAAKSIDSCWSTIANLFAANGLTVKTIDKGKGLITITKTPFISAYTMEDIDGNLEHPGAWVVLEKVYLRKKEWYPKEIFSQWSIQIIEAGKDLTNIKINHFVLCTYYPNMFTTMTNSRCQSTGKLEELIMHSLSQ